MLCTTCLDVDKNKAVPEGGANHWLGVSHEYGWHQKARSEVGAQGLRGSGRSEGRSASHFWEFSLETAGRQEKNRTFHIYKKEDVQQANEVTAGTVGCTV